MNDHPDVFSYILAEKTNWRTVRVPLTNSKDWNMHEHIQRCRNVANAWYHNGKNDGLRPYNDIVTPIIDVAFRSEGFNVSDIVPFVNDPDNYYKSFLVKKFHPKWARKHELDTLIDEVVENSVIFDLALVKDINGERPEVVDLTTIAFCDQTDVLAGPICIEHDYTIADLVDMKGKWNAEMIDAAIVMANEERKINGANDQAMKTPSKYIKVYELHGKLPEKWIKPDAAPHSYADQMHIVCFYNDRAGVKNGITLYEGKAKPIRETFKALKIDTVRSKGRACGKSIVERLFEPQVWNNYGAIKLKEMLDGAIDVFVTDSEIIGNKKLKDLKTNTLLKQEKGANTTRLDSTLQNIVPVTNFQVAQENQARTLGSASEASLGKNPTAGTPFALQSLIVQEGQGIHDYRRGKIATFFADVLYRDLILGYLVKEMNKGDTFSEELSLEELQEVSETIATNYARERVKQLVLEGKDVPPEVQDQLIAMKKEEIQKGGSRKFFQVMKDELRDIPVDVLINVSSKQRAMAQNAERITNIIREIVANPQAFSQIPGIGKAFNQLLEESGLSPIDFTQVTIAPEPLPVAA